jgi:hypothetical protein
MRRISLTILLALFGFAAMAQDKDGVSLEGSGKIITKDVDVKPFDAIQAKGLYELVLIQGDKDAVKIEADDNLMYLFDVTNDGSTLIIDMPLLRANHKSFNIKGKDDKNNPKLKVYVTFKVLKNLDIAVIGNVHADAPLKLDALEIDSKNVGNVTLALSANKLTINNKGVGSFTLSGSATNAVIMNSGVGSLKGDDLVVQTMNIENTGVGSANVNVVKDLMIIDSFLGKVKNSGAAKTHKMDGVEI